MDVPVFAGFWRRFAAYFVDGLLLVIPSFVAGFVLALINSNPWLNYAASIVIAWLYYALFHSSTMQATPGKAAFGIKVTDLAGERISFARATGRYFATWISTLILLIGFIIAAFTAKKQALHDLIAGTLVVRKTASAQEVQEGEGTMPITVGVWIVIVVLFLIPFVVGILAAISIPAYQDYVTRAKMAEVLAEGNAAKADVTRMIAENQLPPAGAPTTLPAHAPNLASIKIESTGRIVMVLKDIRAAPNGRVYLTPEVSSGTVQQWTCSGEDIAPKYLPAACRH